MLAPSRVLFFLIFIDCYLLALWLLAHAKLYLVWGRRWHRVSGPSNSNL